MITYYVFKGVHLSLAHDVLLQAINEEITEQKAKARDFVSRGKKMLRESSLEDDPRLRETVPFTSSAKTESRRSN